MSRSSSYALSEMPDSGDKNKDVEGGSNESAQKSLMQTYVRPGCAELIGVFIFVYVGCLTATTNPDSLVAVALAHGYTIMFLIVGMAHISGGHFNPAITVGVVLAGGLGPVMGAFYVVCQLVGGILGALCVRISHFGATLANNGTDLAGANMPPPDFEYLYDAGPVVTFIFTEMIITYTLVATVLTSVVDSVGSRSNPLAPFAIGMTIAAGVLAEGKITGGSMNPARSFGPAIVQSFTNGDSKAWQFHYVCWIGPILGAVLAAFLYRFVLASNDRRVFSKERRH